MYDKIQASLTLIRQKGVQKITKIKAPATKKPPILYSLPIIIIIIIIIIVDLPILIFK
jgi:hypothetical protein